MRQQLRITDLLSLRCNNLILGLSAMVGIISGVYLLTLSARSVCGKIVDKKNSKKPEKTEEEQFCNVCCGGISIQDAKTFVTCCTCNKRICRDGKCADWLPKTAQWECRLCSPSKGSLAQTSSWVAEQMSFNEQKFVYPMRARSEIYIPISDCNDSSMQFESVSQIDVNSAAISAEQKLKIRKYVEEVVADILGASLDQVPVGQLSKSESYLQLFSKYHPKLRNTFINMENALWQRALKGDLPAVINGDNATTTTATTANNNNNDSHSDLNHISQTRLRQLIQAIIAETVRTPALSVNGDLGPTLDTHASLDQLPLTNGNGQRHRTEQYFKPQYYQDLLATAVLNKIVDKEGNEVHLCASTPDLRAHNIDANFNVENQSTTSGSSVEPKSDCSFNINKDENLSLSGSESERQQLVDDAELIGRESGLSDYIASHMVPLPDLSAPPTESEEDDYISVTSSAIGDGTWQKNWLFKKKRSTIEATATASSVGMLVPAPKEDVRAQIGDKTTDEVSDLSEMGSDTDESSLDLLRGNSDPLFNDRLLNKHLIGGHNTKMVLDELIDRTSLISNSSLPENAPAFTETKNEHVVDNATKTEAINTNVSKLLTPNVDIDVVSPPIPFKDINVITEEDDSNPLSDQLSNDSNYTDDSTSTIIESILEIYDEDNLLLTAPTLIFNNTNNTTNFAATNKKLTNGLLTITNGTSTACSTLLGELIADGLDVDDDDVAPFKRFVPGSIAERECMKWYNAVDMPNNPYSAEALKRRISGSQEKFMDLPNISPSTEQNPIALIPHTEDDVEEESRENDYKRYSRDYYINGDKQTASSPKRLSMSDTTATKTSNNNDEPIMDMVINEAQRNANTTASGPTQSNTASLADTTVVYQAMPAHVVEELASIDTQSNPSLQSVNTTTSDDSDTVRIYDFNKQETTVVREVKNPSQCEAISCSTSMDSTIDTTTMSPTKDNITPTERPKDLQLGASQNTTATPCFTPTRGSTPEAFKFLQPKRKLIDPSQVLSFDDDEPQAPTPPEERTKAIEQDVVPALPSVKALAQAFLLTSNKCSQAENRWLTKTKTSPNKITAAAIPQVMKFEAAPSMAEIADEETLAAIITNTSTMSENNLNTKDEIVTTGQTSPTPVRAGFLKSNIAFFENLKFK